jgi:hypothetical protein
MSGGLGVPSSNLGAPTIHPDPTRDELIRRASGHPVEGRGQTPVSSAQSPSNQSAARVVVNKVLPDFTDLAVGHTGERDVLRDRGSSVSRPPANSNVEEIAVNSHVFVEMVESASQAARTQQA